jgi:hypothetical protein
LQYLLDNLPVRVGTSGAPLIADTGIIGRVTADASESAEAVSMDIIARAFAQWNLPWQLTPFSSSKQRPVNGPEEMHQPQEVGRLCPTLSNGITGTLLSGSRQGQDLEVYSGSCIDLAPGTYTLMNADRDIYCLPYHVKGQAGETHYFRLTCR